MKGKKIFQNTYNFFIKNRREDQNEAPLVVSEHSPSCRDSSHRKEEIRTQKAGVEFRSEWDERT